MGLRYLRVSKPDGSPVADLQRVDLLAAGVDARHFYKDTVTGKRDDLPGLVACLKALREGNTLVVWKLDRLGRDLRHYFDSRQDAGRATSAARPSCPA